MKCKTCNGLGRTYATEFVGVDEGLRDVVILCPACGGSGKVEQTNEEWFCGLPTEEKAHFLSVECARAMCEQQLKITKRNGVDYWKMWLKEKHSE